MALQTAFQALALELEKLRDAMIGLCITIVEDKPLEGGVLLVDKYCDTAEDAVGWVEEALGSANRGVAAVQHPLDVACARHALINCHNAYTRISQRFTTELTAYERMTELTRFGRRRKGEWEAWVVSVKQALDRCQQPLFDVYQSVSCCWEEIADRSTATSVSVRTTSVGQNVVAREQAQEEMG